MLDTFALQRLVWTYCHGIDRRDFGLVRSLYHDDAIDDHGGMFCGSAEAFVAWLPTAMAAWSRTSHTLHNMLFLIDGDHAEGELACTAYHQSLDGRREVIAHGRYLDQYRKRGGVWRFWRRALAADWLEERETAALDPAGVGDGVEAGAASAADPVYRRLPLFAAQRG
jgi:hypothetical protein